MNHWLIRRALTGDAIGIIKVPEHVDIWLTFHPYMPHDGIVIYPISEAEYTSYEALELFPIYKTTSRGKHLTDHVDIYDPGHYYEGEPSEYGGTIPIIRLRRPDRLS